MVATCGVVRLGEVNGCTKENMGNTEEKRLQGEDLKIAMFSRLDEYFIFLDFVSLKNEILMNTLILASSWCVFLTDGRSKRAMA